MNRLHTFLRFTLFRTAMLFTLLGLVVSAGAEGSRDLVESGQGYRPFTEWHNTTDDGGNYSAGIKRQHKVMVYANDGETLYLGSSVPSTETGGGILIKAPDEVETYLEVNSLEDGGDGYIANATMEKNGPAGVKQTADSELTSEDDGYKPIKYEVKQSGVYTLSFYSKVCFNETPNVNPTPAPIGKSGDTFNKQGNIDVAAWDVTVAKSDRVVVEGRVFSNYLSLNVGSNGKKIYSQVYVLTNDGYIYRTDFNGIDTYGFTFFANNRGLINASTNTSLYHSLKDPRSATTPSLDNFIDLLKSDGSPDGVFVNEPQNDDTQLDSAFRIFYNMPSDDLPSSIRTEARKIGEVTDFRFDGGISGKDENVGYVGIGGTFRFNCTDVSSFQVLLDMSSLYYKKSSVSDYKISYENTGDMVYATDDGAGNTIYKDFKTDEIVEDVVISDDQYISCGCIVLSNTAVEGENSITWDGRDVNGRILPAGEYFNSAKSGTGQAKVIPKAGEYHFPMVDVEAMASGIKIYLENPLTDMSDDDRSRIYYNNKNSDRLRTGTISIDGQTVNLDKVWNVGNTPEDKSIEGVASNSEAACVLTGTEGDLSVIDLWTYMTDSSLTVPLEAPAILEEKSDDTVQIKGFVFYDYDGDGTYNMLNNDHGLSGINVTLTTADGTTMTDVTGATGFYSFIVTGSEDVTITVEKIDHTYTCTTEETISVTPEAGYVTRVADVGYYQIPHGSLEIIKHWSIEEKYDPDRPSSVTFTVYTYEADANGEASGEPIDSFDVTLNNDEGFVKKITDLPSCYFDENGDIVELKYDVEEQTPDGYVSEKSVSESYDSDVSAEADGIQPHNHICTFYNKKVNTPYLAFVAEDGIVENGEEPFTQSHVGAAGHVQLTGSKGTEFGNTISTAFAAIIDSSVIPVYSTWEIKIPCKGSYVKDELSKAILGDPVLVDSKNGKIYPITGWSDDAEYIVLKIKHDTDIPKVAGEGRITALYSIVIDNLYAPGAEAYVRTYSSSEEFEQLTEYADIDGIAIDAESLSEYIGHENNSYNSTYSEE